MQKTKITLLMTFIVLGLFFVFTPVVKAEVIKDFSSTINVLPDSSVLINERITYDFEGSIRRGIFRTILLKNSKDEKIEIKVVSVTNEKNEPYLFSTSTNGDVFDIKIGDEDKIVSGTKEYLISYQVFGAVTYYQDFDEIYWNVTGSNWDVAIQKSEVNVVLPNNVFPIQQACYYGRDGDNLNCTKNKANNFTPGVVLNKGEGLTVAVGFPKGVVPVYLRQIDSNFIKFIKLYYPTIIPISIFIYMFLRWIKKGKDPKGTGVIVPYYDVPDNLTPLEVGGIINQKIKNENISAEIIYLATLGYIKIRKIDPDCDNFLCLIKKDDYELTLLKEGGLLENSFDKKIINKIFEEDSNVGGVVLISSLNNTFYKVISSIKDNVIDTLLSKKYYTNFPKSSKASFFTSMISPFIFFSIFYGMLLVISNRNFENIKSQIIFILSILLSFVAWIVFYKLSPAKSKKGVLTKEHLLGLKDYLQIAEKDRINFHNAPEKKPETFEKLLPFAMVLGVEEAWAKEFKDIYTESPEWYEGTNSFNITNFQSDMMLFKNISASSFSAPRQSNMGSGGSSGGGSSGGGGGGGGGGSW